MIVLSDPLSDFAGAEADDRIGTGVVVGIAPENLNAEGTFFQVSCMAVEGGADDVFEQGRIALAAPKMVAGEDRVELFQDEIAVLRRSRGPLLRAMRIFVHEKGQMTP